VNYLLLICNDGESTQEGSAVIRANISNWVQETDSSGARLVGKQLAGPETAKTVRVRDGETLVSDGPFAESKEFIAGFDMISAENLDDAIEIATRHPVSWFHRIEVRPFFDAAQMPEGSELEQPSSDLDERSLRHMLMICLDGIPEADEVEGQLMADGIRWGEQAKAAGKYVFGAPLAHADTAVTVRVRDGQTLLTDGPFVETKEFMGGIVLLSCESEAEAIELAAGHPLAAFHMVEVRPFVGDATS
jgi:hypothetical protein